MEEGWKRKKDRGIEMDGIIQKQKDRRKGTDW